MEDRKNNPIEIFIEDGKFLTSEEGKVFFLETSAETIATAALDSDKVFQQLEYLIRDHSDIGTRRGADLLLKVIEIQNAMLIIGMNRERLKNFQQVMKNKQW